MPPPSLASRPFRFEAAWTTHSQFKDVVANAWESANSLHEATTSFRIAVLDWNSRIFGNIFHRKKRLIARLEGIQRSLSCRISPFLLDLEKTLIKDYNATLKQEELLWLQKSRSDWIASGDRDTKFSSVYYYLP